MESVVTLQHTTHLTLMADRMRYVRKYHYWSQAQLAVKAGVNVSLIKNIESGRAAGERSQERVKRIANTLGVTFDWLTTGKIVFTENKKLQARARV